MRMSAPGRNELWSIGKYYEHTGGLRTLNDEFEQFQ